MDIRRAFRVVGPLLVVSVLTSCSGIPLLQADDPLERAEKNREERMAWWEEARFGMFIHWGLYAVPGGYWKGRQHRGWSEWLMASGIQAEEWRKLAPQFNPVKFNADEWVRIAKDAGMKYIVITSKHHEGFSMWDSKVTAYDIIDATPFDRDPLKELAKACAKQGIRLGFYHSVLDWNHEDYLPRPRWDNRSPQGADFNRYIDFMKAQLTELLTGYGPVAVVWFDGGWEHGAEEYRAEEIVRHIYSLQPDTIINNRMVLPMDFDTPEQKIPKEDIPDRPWETCMTMNNTWGYNRGDKDWKPTQVLIRNLVDIASKGGNFLLNVGPTGEGVIPEGSVERLKEVGQWMRVNGESIYGTGASPFRETPWGRCTVRKLPKRGEILYLHVFDWPRNRRLSVPELGNLPHKAYLLAPGRRPPLLVFHANDVVTIQVPKKAPSPDVSVVALEFDRDGAVTYHPPEIEASSPILLDSIEVRLKTPSRDLKIAYTLDGSDPTPRSLIYKKPIRLTDDAVLKCRSFYGKTYLSEVVEAEFKKVSPHPARQAQGLEPGLAYKYCEGTWDKTPDFDLLGSAASGVTRGIDLSMSLRDELMGVQFSGCVVAPKDGVYTFSLASDDGSVLFVDDTLVVDNDGLHSVVAKEGAIALAKGAHAIRLGYFNRSGGKRLELKWALEGKEMRPIPPGRLRHAPEK
ncbi:MAG TPA: alpha-L-fucosidase [Sumerlaeia bacterium]|nr:alpha-L-fucosidase [Sumerlaeia bacterium]